MSACAPAALPGDLDGDGDVDQHDLNILLEALNTPASGPDDARDLDGDGMITGLDARKLVVLCTLPGCAVPPKVAITSPDDLSIFGASPITVTGETPESVEQVSVNGVLATLDGLTWSAEVPLQEGDNVITATATDAGGNESTASIQVALDTIPPALVITSPAEGEVLAETRPAIAVSYSDEHGVEPDSLAFTANGSDLAVDCTLTETGGSCTPTGFLPTGAVALVATVADSLGNGASAQVSFAIGAAPLAITITQPAKGAVFGASPITVRGEVSDPSAAVMVDDVFATVSGTTFEATAVVITEGPNTLTARTRNDAREEAAATSSVILDTRPPTLSILSPDDRSVLTEPSTDVFGFVSDETSLSATIDGEPASVSEDRLTGMAELVAGENRVTVMARDAAGNETTQMLTLYVDAVPLAVTDMTPGDGTLDVDPSSAVTATFSEPVDPASLGASSFFLQTDSSILPAAVAVAADELSATLTPSRPLPSGSPIEVSVTTAATDAAGNPMPSPFRSGFTTAGELAEPGVVIGEVYDDTKSLPLKDASVAALDPDTQAVLGQTESGKRGRYLLSPGRSDVVVRVTKAGFTIVERAATTRRGSFAEVLDARLTPLAEAQAVQAVLPAEVRSSEGDLLEIPPGAFDADGEVRLTAVSSQGPRGPFPAGWIPLAIVDIAASEPFDPPATLSMLDRSGLAAGKQAVASRYDPSSASWVAVSKVTITPSGAVEVGAVTEGGQFAVLLSDPGDGAPPPAVEGAAMAAGSSIPIPEDADGTGIVSPPLKRLAEATQDGANVAIAADAPLPDATTPLRDFVGLISDPTPAVANVTITADAPLRSGTPLLGDFHELFILRNGGTLTPLSTSQDLFVYRSLEDPTGQTLTASFAIGPSMIFSLLEAREGNITVTLRRTSPIARDVIGVDGGGVQTGDGSRVIVPPGALGGEVPIHLARIPEQDFGVATPEDLTFLGGLELDLASVTATNELSLSLGGRASFVPTGGQVVVARIETVRGQAQLVPVALARTDGDDLTTFTELGDASLPGVLSGGRYGFYLLSSPVEIVEGTARDQTGNVEGLTVQVEGMPFASVTDSSGRFALVSPPGDFTLVATSGSTLDEGRVHGTTGEPVAELVLSATPPFVEQITLRPPRVEGNYTGPVVLLGKPAPQIDDDSSGSSSGNGNGQIEAGESIELTLTVRNEGNVAVQGGFFVLDVRGLLLASDRVAIDTLAPDELVSVGPFGFEIPAASDPSTLRYTLSRFSDDGGRPNDMTFTLPLDAEHVNVPVDSEVTVVFSEPVAAASLDGAMTLALDDGGTLVPVPGKFLITSDATAVTLRPLQALADGSLYRLTLADSIVDRDNLPLVQAPLMERIRTQDLTPPGPIDPGNIEASVPDDEGFVTVTGTLGSVNPEDTLIVLNETTGFVVVASVEADGSFTARIPAEMSQGLQLISYDPYGNETTIDVSGFVRRDPDTGEVLSVVVGRDGGTVSGPDGIELAVPTGAVVGAAEVAVTRSEVPFALPDDLAGDPEVVAAFDALFTVVDRIRIDADVLHFAAPVALSMPAPATAQAGDLYIVARTRAVTIGGPLADLDRSEGLTAAENPLRAVERLEILDSATVKSVGTSLVLSTDSPPFAGIKAPGTFTLLEPGQALTFIAGEVRRDTIAGSPIAGAVVRSLPGVPETSMLAAVTDADGRFIVADGSIGGPYAQGTVLASRLDVTDPDFDRVIRRDVRGVVELPAPPSANVAHLGEPFVLPTNLPAAVVDVLGDLEPPTVQIVLAGSSVGQGYAVLGDPLTITVAAEDNDEITFVGLDMDLGSGLAAVPLEPDGSYAFVPFAPGLIPLRAQAQDRTGNTTFADKNLQIIALDADGAPAPPPSDPDRAPTILLPTEPAELDSDAPVPAPVIPDADEISFDGDIVILFSEPLDPATVNEDTIEVLDPELVPIPIDVTTEFGDSAVRISPKRNLRLGARYEATVSNAVEDRDGQNVSETKVEWECPPPEQVATIDLPNATDVALIDHLETLDEETGETYQLEDVLVAVNFPLGGDEPGAIHTYEVRDRDDPEILLEKPTLLGSAPTLGNPWSLAVDENRAYVGNAWNGAIVLRAGNISYTTELYGIHLGVFHEGLRANVGYQWSDELPNPPSNLEVFDLSEPTAPAQLGSQLANFGRIFSAPGVTPLWDPNVLPTRVEVTQQGVAVLGHLENIEIFNMEAPFSSKGVLESIWGPGVKPGRCQGGSEDGQMCPVSYTPPFWHCLGDAQCLPTDEFYDAAFYDAADDRPAFAVVLQRDQNGIGARIIRTDTAGDPLVPDSTLATLAIPAEARSHFGRVGAVPEFEWDETDPDSGFVTTHLDDLAFIATPGDQQLRIFDVTDPAFPNELTTPETRLQNVFGNMSLDPCTGLAYLHGRGGDFHVVDFEDPRKPIELNDPGSGQEPFRVEGLGQTVSFNGNTTAEHTVYLAEESGIGVIRARLCTTMNLAATSTSQLSASATGPVNSTLLATRAGPNRRPPRVAACRNVPFKRLLKQSGKCRLVDLDVKGIKEKREDKPGAVILWNNDDDNENDVDDGEEATVPSRENDLTPITLTVRKKGEILKRDPNATVTLECPGCKRVRNGLPSAGAPEVEGLRVYDSRGREVELPKECALRSFPTCIDSSVPSPKKGTASVKLRVAGRARSVHVNDTELNLAVDFTDAGAPRFPEDSVALTVADIKLEPITATTTDKGLHVNPSGIGAGKKATFLIGIEPDLAPKRVEWTGPSAQLKGLPATGEEVVLTARTSLGPANLTVDIEGFTGRPPKIQTRVLKNEIVPIRAFIICDNAGVACATDVATVRKILKEANQVFRQVAITFKLGKVRTGAESGKSGKFLRKTDFLEIRDDMTDPDTIALLNLRSGTKWNGLELYYVDSIVGAHFGFETNRGIVVQGNATPWTTAHELGHSLGLKDIYPARPRNDGTAPLSTDYLLQLPRKAQMKQDWNNGLDARYYPTRVFEFGSYRKPERIDIINRLLMCGEYCDKGETGDADNRRADISTGRVNGYYWVNEAKGISAKGPVDVGLTGGSRPSSASDSLPITMNRTPVHQ